MNKNKGFTLVELIGIVIVLGLLVIIGIPSLIKTMKVNQNREYEVFEKNLFLATETYVANHIEEIDELKVVGGTYYVFTSYLLEEKLIKQKNLYNPKTKRNLTDNAAIKVTVSEDSSYEYVLTTYDPPVYANGTIVYFNPVTGEFCSDYTNTNSGNGVTEGCMKWYIFNDYKKAEKINLLLDHNTTSIMLMSSAVGTNVNDVTLDNIITTINTDTASWKTSLNPRLLSMMDLRNILNEDATGISSMISFGNSSCNSGNYKQKSLKAWLFDRTSYSYNITYATCRDADKVCTKCGASNVATGQGSTSCSITNHSSRKNYFRGYLVGDYAYNDSRTVSLSINRVIDYRGILNTMVIGWESNYGIRPVITIDKSLVSGNATPCSSTYSCDFCKTTTCGEYVSQ